MAYNPGGTGNIGTGNMGSGDLLGLSGGSDTSAAGSGAVAKSCVLAGTRVIFELEWSPTQDREDPAAEFQRARKLGYSFATMLPDKSLIGLTRGLQAGPGRPHSAVVLLIERFASGGAEAVLLSAGNRVAFIGLMDRRPVPGFDRLVHSLEAALALLKEFRDIHIDQDVRVATDLRDAIPNGEPLPVQAIFEMPEATSLVRPLINRVLRRTLVGGVAVALLAGSGLGYMLWNQYQARKAAEEAARLARENDPNRLYEQAIETLMAGAGQPGNTVLDHWRTLLSRVPLTREGWALQRFTCSQTSRDCQATWTRNFGNFQDFLTDAPRPDPASPAPQVTADGNGDLLGATITTHYSWEEGAPAPSLVREQLPLVDGVTQTWGSRLQDLSLVAGNAQAASLKPARLFGPPSVTQLTALHRPVVSLSWQVTDGVWSLPSIELPPSAVPETLTVLLTPGQVTYTLTGQIYAKGKPF
ncbi:type 4b pilus protein PilO2 [Roseateles depolymerans]|uniref:Uncharacterized protein n=1 Tax=Roseateles depolymerans TaxID=76731 RepID=A0A0U3MRA4_9BURK|nr:type 4b pilus protein PilO2 [Roseateles depolymerans]ALV06810.1 hypothetical protein RD2015_2339 [Roseateles depolymerans]REG19788.1 pilin accessory protein (PilO) [Roseateles depolymerans]